MSYNEPNYGIFIKGPKSEITGSNSTGQETITTTTLPWIPTEMFHPHGQYKPNAGADSIEMEHGQVTGVKYLAGDKFEDISLLFAPIQYGSALEEPTGLKIKTDNGIKDMSELFAKIGTVPVPLEIEPIAAGGFKCDTYIHTYIDNSGSSNATKQAAIDFVSELRTYLKKIYYGNSTATANTYVKTPVSKNDERWLNWLGTANEASQTPHNMVALAFINESNVYHPNHPTSQWTTDLTTFIDNYNTWTGQPGGGHKTAVFSTGGETWWNYQFESHLALATGDLASYDFQAFSDLANNRTKAQHTDMFISMLNVPQKPSELACNITNFESEQHKLTVTWKFTDYICGITGTYAPSRSDRFSATMSGWKIEISTNSNGASPFYTSSETTTHPSTHTYTQTVKRGARFWARITAVGAGGQSSKSSDWVQCLMQNDPPIITIIGGNVEQHAGTSYSDAGFSATDDHDEESALTKSTDMGGFNKDIPGVYTITYTATDTSGATATATRTVNITLAEPVVTSTTPSNEPRPTWTWSSITGATEYDVKIGASGSESQVTTTSFTPGSNLSTDDEQTLYVRASRDTIKSSWAVFTVERFNEDLFTRTEQEESTEQVCSATQTFSQRWGHSGACQYGSTNISGPFTLDEDALALNGNMLPIKSFYLDDCAFLVPPRDDSTSYANGGWSYSRDVSNHNIKLPSWRCLMITMNPIGGGSLMVGAIDGGGATYQHAGQSYSHGNAAANTVATGLANLGVPVLAYWQISRYYLRRLGFTSTDGKKIQFRILHDGQGCGGIYMDVDIQVCTELPRLAYPQFIIATGADDLVNTTLSPTTDATPKWKWSAVDGATGYTLSLNNGTEFTQTGTSWTSPTGLSVGDHTLRVKATGPANYEPGLYASATITVQQVLSTPSPSVAATTTDRTPTWNWGAISNASKYQYILNGGSAVDTTSTSFTPSSNLNLGNNTLKVRAVGSGNYLTSSYSATATVKVQAKLGTPTIGSVTSPTTDRTPTWSWGAVSNASSYQISLNGGSAQSTGTSTSFTPSSNLTLGTHKLKVRAVGTGNYITGDYSGEKTIHVKANLSTPAGLSVSPSGTTSNTRPTWTWNAVSNASSYQIRLNSGTAVSVGSNTTYTPGSDLAGTQSLQVRAVGSGNYNTSSWSSAVAVTIIGDWSLLTGTGTLNVPTGATYQVLMWGAGGGGGGGVGGGGGGCDDSGGGGGASGHVVLKTLTAGTWSYSCGTGGAGGWSACNPGTGDTGSKGGSTTMTLGGTTHTAKGGNGGIAGTRSNNPGGEGGATNASDGFNLAGGKAGQGCNYGNAGTTTGAKYFGTPGAGGSNDNEGGGGGGGAPAGIDAATMPTPEGLSNAGKLATFTGYLGDGGKGSDKSGGNPGDGGSYAAGGGGGSRCNSAADGGPGMILWRSSG